MFTALMMVNVGLVGFIGSNFGSIAMEDFGHMAGVASSYQSFAKTLLAATVGASIRHIAGRSSRRKVRIDGHRGLRPERRLWGGKRTRLYQPISSLEAS